MSGYSVYIDIRVFFTCHQLQLLRLNTREPNIIISTHNENHTHQIKYLHGTVSYGSLICVVIWNCFILIFNVCAYLELFHIDL